MGKRFAWIEFHSGSVKQPRIALRVTSLSRGHYFIQDHPQLKPFRNGRERPALFCFFCVQMMNAEQA
jgi:hypothetical protein